VLTTVVGEGPAALPVVFGAAIADGSIASESAKVIAASDLLPFMVHQYLCVGISV
jgi:hypothetical protein